MFVTCEYLHSRRRATSVIIVGAAWAALVIPATCQGQGYTITTVAGGGLRGVLGDGGPATSAFLDWPSAVAADAAGNLFIADAYYCVIRKVSPAGIISTVAGNASLGCGPSADGGPAIKAELYYPHTPRQYVTAPNPTPYPPNLVHALESVAAVRRESCIVFRASTPGLSAIGYGERTPLAPPESTESDRQNTYRDYRKRMQDCKLHAALCRIEIVKGREALALDPARAPVLSANECQEWRASGNGRRIAEEFAADLRSRIAEAGQLVP